MALVHGVLQVNEDINTPTYYLELEGPSVNIFNPSSYRTVYLGGGPYVSHDFGMPLRPGERLTIAVNDGEKLYAYAPEDNIGIAALKLPVLYHS